MERKKEHFSEEEKLNVSLEGRMWYVRICESKSILWEWL